MSFRIVPKSVTLSDLERRNIPYFALFLPNLVVSRAPCVKVVDKAKQWRNYERRGEAIASGRLAQGGALSRRIIYFLLCN